MIVTKTIVPSCGLDPRVLNNETIAELNDIGLSFFAPLCGRNRGAFVVDPSDGKTWGCTSLPPTLAVMAGAVTDPETIYLKDANAIKNAFLAGNTTAADTVTILDYFVSSVYKSSYGVDQDMYACELGGLAKLSCPNSNSAPYPNTLPQPIRSTTMAGVFTPAYFVTGGKILKLEEAKIFYTEDDFQRMKKIGLNTVQIPFPVHAFDHYDTEAAWIDYLTTVVGMIHGAGLTAILELVGVDNDAAVSAAVHYIADNKYPGAIGALIVPSLQSVTAARATGVNLTLFVPVNEGQLKDLVFPDPNIYAAISLGHSTAIADIASSTSLDDRMKMFYHESKSCIFRSPLEYSKCYRNIPVYVASGFDLSIDNCAFANELMDGIDTHYAATVTPFVNYGQCDHFNETVNSRWWYHHRKSFAARQMFSYEQGMGWSYAAWKLYNNSKDDDDRSSVLSSLDKPEALLAFENVYAAGLIMELGSSNSTSSILMSCLNPPLADFVMGDATFAPTPAPPPDCGYGWWNASINACSYWVPPPTDPPTMKPSSEPCPAVPLDFSFMPTNAKTKMLASTTTNSDALFRQIEAGSIGIVLGIILCYVYMRRCSRRQGYSLID